MASVWFLVTNECSKPTRKIGVHGCDANTWDVGEGSGLQGHPLVHRRLEFGLRYFCARVSGTKQNNTGKQQGWGWNSAGGGLPSMLKPLGSVSGTT